MSRLNYNRWTEKEVEVKVSQSYVFASGVVRPPGFEPGSPAFFTLRLWEAEVLDQARPRPHNTT